MKRKYGIYGGQFVSEQLMAPLKALEKAFLDCIKDPSFQDEYQTLLRDYIGRETPLYFAKNLTEHCGGARIYLKREDLNHTGAHKINNAIGQAMVAKRMGKQHIIAETGAGQHGVATATACALLNMACTVFMGAEDIRRQAPNVARMKLLGAEIISVTSGTSVLKDATNEAIRYWIEHVDTCHYIIGSAIGPYPYPAIVRHFQSVIGKETKNQFNQLHESQPNCVIACVGGGSNAIGMFSQFLEDDVRLIGVEAAGKGIDTPYHAATLTKGRPGILHGSLMYLLQKDGNIDEVYSLSAGLDYPGVGPEHCHLKDIARVEYTAITDDEAVHAFHLLSRKEGIIPALESSHAVAEALKVAAGMSSEDNLIVCLSGRGDKDLNTILSGEV